MTGVFTRTLQSKEAGSVPASSIVHERLEDVFLRLRRAACAPFLPRAVLVDFDRCAMVRFRRAAFAAFLTLRRAVDRCLVVAMRLPLSVDRHIDEHVAYQVLLHTETSPDDSLTTLLVDHETASPNGDNRGARLGVGTTRA